MGSRELKAHCALDEHTMDLLKFAMDDLRLSARAYDRILKVDRTIADLAGSTTILMRWLHHRSVVALGCVRGGRLDPKDRTIAQDKVSQH